MNKNIEILLNLGLDFNHLYVLKNYDDLPSHPKILGWKEFVKLKGLIDEMGAITPDGAELLNLFKKDNDTEKQSKFDGWCEETSKELELYFVSLTGFKANYKGFGGVPFLPTSQELCRHLKAFWKEYKTYTNLNQIKDILKSHIKECHEKNNYAPAVKYFIHKSGKGTFLGSAYKFYKEEDKGEVVVDNVKRNKLF